MENTPGDARLLWMAVELEEQCVLRFLEMAAAFQFVDEPRAEFFRRLAMDEESHRDRLVRAWQKLDAEPIPRPELWPWLAREHKAATEMWDQEDGDAPSALERARAIEEASQRFYGDAAERAERPDVRQLFRSIAGAEASHLRAAAHGR